jgi:CheY-like chemotaxis protein
VPKQWVLVVDDDPAMVMLVSERLEMEGYSVTTANDAAQAYIQAETLNPKLVVLDMQMPGFGTGADALRKFREHPRLANIPVIILTGMEPSKARAMLPDDPLVQLMTKPPDWQMLNKIVAMMINMAPGGGTPA